MTKAVRAEEVSAYLGLPLHGPDCRLTSVSSFETPKSNTMIFVERASASSWERLSPLTEVLVFCPDELGMSLTCATIITDNPRLAFIKAVNRFFTHLAGSPFSSGVGPGSIIADSAAIGKNVSIGCNCVIGPDVSIGANTVILNNVVLTGRVSLGEGCFIKSGAVIGETGFGFCLDEDGAPLQMPHFGGVLIGDCVSIGANSTIERGIFDSTIIADHVKIDDLVQVGHNACIGQSTRIAAGAILCGSAKVGERSWIAPNATVRERTKIGNDACIGLAANVLEEVPDHATVVGNPARSLIRRTTS